MPIFQQDIIKHRNGKLAVVDSDDIRGGRRTAVDLQALYALGDRLDQMKEGVTIVRVLSEGKDYLLLNKALINSSTGWEQVEYVRASQVSSAVQNAVTQLIGTADSNNNTLGKLSEKLAALSSIVGSSASDNDNIVNTVAELLSIFQTFPEETNIALELAGKVSKTDIVNGLTTVVPGKVLDAVQGKMLADLIENLTGALAQKTNTADLAVIFQGLDNLAFLINLLRVPAGGEAGQVLAKQTNFDNQLEWIDLEATGGLSPAEIEALPVYDTLAELAASSLPVYGKYRTSSGFIKLKPVPEKQPQTIEAFTSSIPGGVVFVGTSNIYFTVYSSSDLPVTLTVDHPERATISASGNLRYITALEAGPVTVTVTQPGDAAFLPAEPVIVNFMVQVPVVAPKFSFLASANDVTNNGGQLTGNLRIGLFANDAGNTVATSARLDEDGLLDVGTEFESFAYGIFPDSVKSINVRSSKPMYPYTKVTFKVTDNTNPYSPVVVHDFTQVYGDYPGNSIILSSYTLPSVSDDGTKYLIEFKTENYVHLVTALPNDKYLNVDFRSVKPTLVGSLFLSEIEIGLCYDDRTISYAMNSVSPSRITFMENYWMDNFYPADAANLNLLRARVKYELLPYTRVTLEVVDVTDPDNLQVISGDSQDFPTSPAIDTYILNDVHLPNDADINDGRKFLIVAKTEIYTP